MGCRTHIADITESRDDVQLEAAFELPAIRKDCSTSGIMKGIMLIVRFARKMDSLKLPVLLKTGVLRLLDRNVRRSLVTFNTATLLSNRVAFQPIVPLVSMVGRAVAVSFKGQKITFVCTPELALI